MLFSQDKITAHRLLILAAGFSVAMLMAAWVAQYGFGLYPCDLCLYQRYPYMAIALLAAVAAWRGSPKAQYRIIWVCAGLFFVDAGIAAYHTGVELHWFPGPSGCTSTSTAGDTLEDMRAQIMGAPLVACDQAMAYLWGLSLAAWNAIAATLAGMTLVAWLLTRKKSA
jgi:disulfide bond formation protein DsbB